MSKDDRYQFQPWYIKVYRRIRWYLPHAIVTSYRLFLWLLQGAKIPECEKDWFKSRYHYAKHLWIMCSSLAHMKMKYYYTLDEVIQHCRERINEKD
jgi:hypothetical protein